MTTNILLRTAVAAAGLTAVAGAAMLTTAGASSAQTGPDKAKGGTKLNAVLLGTSEVPAGTGDPDGTGAARVTVNPGQGTVCWSISVENIAAPTRGHIHIGSAGANGGITVTLFEGASVLEGCTTSTFAKEIAKNPAGYYVNLHNAAFPTGAVRGQLSR